MKKIFCLVAVFFFGASFSSCVTEKVQISGLDKKFGAFSFIREDSNLVMIVDVELAKSRVDENFFPLGIKIANKKLESLIVDRKGLLLVDENDVVYYMPDILELQKSYDKLAPDHKFKIQTGLLGDRMVTSFSFYRQAESNFFPQTQGAARVIDSVYLQKNGFMEDLIYFPRPLGGIKGKRLRLRLDVFGYDQPFEVAFSVD